MSAASVPILSDARRLREGQGLRFEVVLDGVSRDAFAVRWHGRVHAYVNEAYDALVCCHHGARYRPDDGVCVAGPCVGGRLTRLEVVERDGALWWEDVAR